MSSLPRTSLLRGPLVVVAIFVLALMALYPGASLRGQSAPVAVATTPALNTPPAPAASVAPDSVDGEVSDMYVKGKSLEVRYKNTGAVATDILGEVQVRDASDELVMALPLVEGRRIGAGRSEKFRIAMPTLPPGKYTLFAVVDFGGAALTAAQAELEIRP